MKAQRDNDGKLRYDLLPLEWEEELVKILTFGAQKYAPDNWKLSMNTEDHEQFMKDRYESARRHSQARRKGQILDPASGLPHLAHVAWNALAMMSYDLAEANALQTFGEQIHVSPGGIGMGEIPAIKLECPECGTFTMIPRTDYVDGVYFCFNCKKTWREGLWGEELYQLPAPPPHKLKQSEQDRYNQAVLNEKT